MASSSKLMVRVAGVNVTPATVPTCAYVGVGSPSASGTTISAMAVPTSPVMSVPVSSVKDGGGRNEDQKRTVQNFVPPEPLCALDHVAPPS